MLSSEIKIIHVPFNLEYAWLYVGRPQLSSGMGLKITFHSNPTTHDNKL